ncbi:MAG: FCD domain-containing protein, partial [Nitratireductor sp.]|nr:FCD domain-containing protein [Nitratireductor sp.]
NEVMERMVKELVTRTSLIIGMYGASGTKNCHDDEHGEILEALRNMNSDIAASLMEQHLRHIERDVDLTSERRRQVDLIEILAGSANSSR